MLFLIKQILVIGLLIVFTNESIVAQLRTEIVDGDTLLIFTHLMRDRFDEEVTATVLKVDSSFKYEYEIHNKPNSQQSIWFWLFISEAPLFDPIVPNGWRFINRGSPTRVNWGAQSEEAQISPGNIIGSFGFYTNSPPSIENYYMEGWAQFILQEEPDSVENSSFFDVVKKGTTIFPREAPITSLSEHIDTLETYRQRSCEELGWANDPAVCSRLEEDLNQVRSNLSAGDSLAAAGALSEFINLVESEKEASLSSEGYALLFFNADYLAGRLPSN